MCNAIRLKALDENLAAHFLLFTTMCLYRLSENNRLNKVRVHDEMLNELLHRAKINMINGNIIFERNFTRY